MAEVCTLPVLASLNAEYSYVFTAETYPRAPIVESIHSIHPVRWIQAGICCDTRCYICHVGRPSLATVCRGIKE